MGVSTMLGEGPYERHLPALPHHAKDTSSAIQNGFGQSGLMGLRSRLRRNLAFKSKLDIEAFVAIR